MASLLSVVDCVERLGEAGEARTSTCFGRYPLPADARSRDRHALTLTCAEGIGRSRLFSHGIGSYVRKAGSPVVFVPHDVTLKLELDGRGHARERALISQMLLLGGDAQQKSTVVTFASNENNLRGGCWSRFSWRSACDDGVLDHDLPLKRRERTGLSSVK